MFYKCSGLSLRRPAVMAKKSDVRKAANDAATVERIAGIIEARTASLLSMHSTE